jgi:hypothetical protein
LLEIKDCSSSRDACSTAAIFSIASEGDYVDPA